jgi:hypothetical protein
MGFILAIVVLASLLTSCGSADTNSASSAATAEASVVSFMSRQLDSYADGVDGPLKNGVWTDSDPAGNCWACDNGGPATGAATLYVLTGHSNASLLRDAEQTINTAIVREQAPNGGFIAPGQPSLEGVQTMFFGVEFGTTYRLISRYLRPSTRAAWQRSLAAAASYLIDSGDTTWYANGNINLGDTELLWLAWKATGKTRFKQAYNASWSFTLHPPQAKFPGCGWITVRPSTTADGSNGEGYFAESGGSGCGDDPEYSMLQLDVASRLYLLSGDRRALRAANMLVNMELSRVNTATWMLDTSDGTRHTQADRYVGFQTSAFAVLGLLTGRSNLTSYLLPQLEQEEQWYPQPYQADASGFRRAFGDSVAVIALAAARADTQLAPSVRSSVRSLKLSGARR